MELSKKCKTLGAHSATPESPSHHFYVLDTFLGTEQVWSGDNFLSREVARSRGNKKPVHAVLWNLRGRHSAGLVNGELYKILMFCICLIQKKKRQTIEKQREKESKSDDYGPRYSRS